MWVTAVWRGQFVGARAMQSVFIPSELALWSPFPINGYLAQPMCRRDGLDPASSDVTDFVDSPWESLPPLKHFCGWGWEKVGKAGGQEGEEIVMSK